MLPSSSKVKIKLSPRQNFSFSSGSIGQLLSAGEKFLTQKGIATSRLTAELLLALVLQCDRTALYQRLNEEVMGDPLREFWRLMERRGNHYPLQYLTGHQEFWSLDFEVTPGIFIPRPDSEVVVEEVIKHNTLPHPIRS